MTSQLVECPQCQAPLSLTPGRKFCQCPYCGSKFAIELPDGQSPRLARFDAVLSTPAGKAVLRDARERLSELELTLADAEDEVEWKQAELAEAKSFYWQTRVNLQRLIAPLQNTTYVAGLLAALAAFAALFVFRRSERLPGAAIAVLLALTAWAFHCEWQEAQGLGQGECEEARVAIGEAEGELQSALARQEDQSLERELLQRQVLPAQPLPAAQSRGGASAT